MCGRFTLAKPREEIEALLGDVESPVPVAPRYNIAPSQPVLTVLNRAPRRLVFTQWGLVPPWAKDPAIGSRLINARAETVAVKPAFRHGFRTSRCLILADGFYEWKKTAGRTVKQPMHIRLRSGEPFAFAGLWAEWQGPDGSQRTTSTIITTTPNPLLAAIHNRMPAILPRDGYATWLDTTTPDARALQALLVPYPAAEMEASPVSRKVNNVRYDEPDCIATENSAAPAQPELF